MKEREFNLLDEKWVRVMAADCTVREVSLVDALVNAHEYTSLAGELPTQDMAMLRLLLAVLHTVFARFDEEGNDAPFECADDALDRWEALWNGGRFPEKPIRKYLEAYRDRFYLFDPDRPFYQVNEAEGGTENEAKKLNGCISESNNKFRLFSSRCGEGKNILTYPEAARWLVCLNGFDDIALKEAQNTDDGSNTDEGSDTDKERNSLKVGWLGQLGSIYALGDNLFQTLMLNLVLLNENRELWGENKPVWELVKPRTRQKCKIAVPDNQAELLTLQSRRTLLQRDERGVIGYTVLGGDVFESDKASAEQMTIWEYVKGKIGELPYYQPREHNANKQIWREFASIVPSDDKRGMPGVVRWQALLKEGEILEEERFARFSMVGVEYKGSQKSAVVDIFSDSLSFHIDLLTEVGRHWNIAIQSEIEIIDEVAKAVGQLGEQIEKACGKSESSKKDKKKDNNGLGNWMKEQFYYRIDIDFRLMLEGIDPMDEDHETREEWAWAWRKIEKGITDQLTGDVIAQSDQNAIMGRTIAVRNSKGKEEKQRYSMAEAYSRFNYKIRNLLVKGDEQ